jgi:hypothetical protein
VDTLIVEDCAGDEAMARPTAKDAAAAMVTGCRIIQILPRKVKKQPLCARLLLLARPVINNSAAHKRVW